LSSSKNGETVSVDRSSSGITENTGRGGDDTDVAHDRADTADPPKSASKPISAPAAGGESRRSEKAYQQEGEQCHGYDVDDKYLTAEPVNLAPKSPPLAKRRALRNAKKASPPSWEGTRTVHSKSWRWPAESGLRISGKSERSAWLFQ
jgi:hypothetical protein